MDPVPRRFYDNPLLIAEVATGVRKDRWRREAGTVLGLRLEDLMAISFCVLDGRTSIREDRLCEDGWMAENHVLHQDMRVLHGRDEMVVEEVRTWPMTEKEAAEDMRALRGSEMSIWG